MADVLTPGQVVAGRFRIEEVIGEGGMGMVYLARHLTLRRPVAIKVLKGNYGADETFVERFRREAIAASQVVHPNVVSITDFGQLDDGAFYIVMEYLQGVGLDQVLDSGGAQPLTRVMNILIQLADALETSASAGVVHRDLKPENVMLCAIRGRKDVVKLVDFGIAKLLSPEYRNKRTTLSGQISSGPPSTFLPRAPWTWRWTGARTSTPWACSPSSSPRETRPSSASRTKCCRCTSRSPLPPRRPGCRVG